MRAGRRAFLKLSGGVVLASVVGPRSLAARADGGVLYASCVRLEGDRWGVAVMEEDGAIRFLHPLPERGHDVAFDPVSRRCVAFARRPGRFAVVFDAAGRDEPRLIAAAPRRTFFGHGVFSADGRILYATENDFERGVGAIGIWETAGWTRVGEFGSGGVGPHELIWLADGKTLAVANGGLDTDEAFGRVNLNTAEMQPNLSLVEADGGRVLSTARLGPDLAALSIRHLALDAKGAVWFGCQHEGDPTDLPPLAGRLMPGREAELFDLPDEIAARPKNYVGSVATSSDGEAVVFSAPKGSLVFAFAAGSGRFLGSADFEDGCGIAPGPEAGPTLRATSGMGRVAALDPMGKMALDPLGRDDLSFDNHLNRLL